MKSKCGNSACSATSWSLDWPFWTWKHWQADWTGCVRAILGSGVKSNDAIMLQNYLSCDSIIVIAVVETCDGAIAARASKLLVETPDIASSLKWLTGSCKKVTNLPTESNRIQKTGSVDAKTRAAMAQLGALHELGAIKIIHDWHVQLLIDPALHKHQRLESSGEDSLPSRLIFPSSNCTPNRPKPILHIEAWDTPHAPAAEPVVPHWKNASGVKPTTQRVCDLPWKIDLKNCSRRFYLYHSVLL